LRYGIQQATLDGFRNIHIEEDSKIVIPAIQENIQLPWKLDFIIRDIKIFTSKVDQILFIILSGEANFANDWIASLGHSIPSSL